MLIKHQTNRALGHPRGRTILKVHAIPRRQSTLLPVQDLARGTRRQIDRRTLPGILCDAFLPVEVHVGRTGGFAVGDAFPV